MIYWVSSFAGAQHDKLEAAQHDIRWATRFFASLRMTSRCFLHQPRSGQLARDFRSNMLEAMLNLSRPCYPLTDLILNDLYCIRCHDPESTPERVSNFDNLSPAPHQFTDGATYNRLSDTDLINVIAHGGPAMGKSPQMPAYGATLKPAETKALLAYIRSIADPPYQPSGVKYGK